MGQTISSKQKDILQCIYDYVKSRGYPPTVREICEEVGLSSTSTVHGYLSRLQNHGFLQRNPTKPRALEITNTGLAAINVQQAQIPVLGIVTAGEPILAIQQNATDFFPLPPDLQSIDGQLFMLTIQGSSMINAGILNGDQVIVHQQNTAENGEIVIAMNSDNEATCKRFYQESDHIRLQPENDEFDPIILQTATILGKVVGLYRQHIF
ncbi:transcriptional repressor LexA [Bombilactobacillus bombi]|uniref:transcriptional repressor LexA n=1 Tax=Bombilactobacillus bombi TaxID=1303590 RepID=UPI000E56D973|nr:transcriptional repressor LexA [Bombilactobacillus bombi]AXX64363.1 transcriptional repressor LexA [Bombilactobacillus bombi]MCO6541628.1 transcriptional repressor LexA [Lactobacillus sp.]